MPIWTEIGQTYDMDRLWTKSGLVILTSIWSKYKYCSNGQILDKVMTWTDSGLSLDLYRETRTTLPINHILTVSDHIINFSWSVTNTHPMMYQ